MGVLPDYLADLVPVQRRPFREARGVIYNALYRAARRGEPCPTHEDLNEICGFSSSSSSPYIVADLERSGLIRVWRYQRSRVVQIVCTGERTAHVGCDRPHVPRGRGSIQSRPGLVQEGA